MTGAMAFGRGVQGPWEPGRKEMGGKRSDHSLPPFLPSPPHLLELHWLKPTGNTHTSGPVGTLSMGQSPEAQSRQKKGGWHTAGANSKTSLFRALVFILRVVGSHGSDTVTALSGVF